MPGLGLPSSGARSLDICTPTMHTYDVRPLAEHSKIELHLCLNYQLLQTHEKSNGHSFLCMDKFGNANPKTDMQAVALNVLTR